MKKRIVVASVVAISVLVIVLMRRDVENYRDLPELTIRAQPVQDSASSPGSIQGSFSLEVADPALARAPGAIKSKGSGGACLIADLNPAGIPANFPGTCSSNAQCTAAIKATDPKWWGYCVDGVCWTRPGSDKDFCLKSTPDNSGNPWPPGSHALRPVAKDLFSANKKIQGKVDWRVHACLNGYALGFNQDNAACKDGTGARLTHDGPIRTVP